MPDDADWRDDYKMPPAPVVKTLKVIPEGWCGVPRELLRETLVYLKCNCRVFPGLVRREARQRLREKGIDGIDEINDALMAELESIVRRLEEATNDG